jgi:REP element-mobilizing transposase RayT
VPRLRRIYGLGYLHFITFSCYRRLPMLDSAKRRDLFLRTLEQVRRRYRFVVAGYVTMPERVHLLVSEPERGNPGTVVQVLKQRVTRAGTSGELDRKPKSAAAGIPRPSKTAKTGAASVRIAAGKGQASPPGRYCVGRNRGRRNRC